MNKAYEAKVERRGRSLEVLVRAQPVATKIFLMQNWKCDLNEEMTDFCSRLGAKQYANFFSPTQICETCTVWHNSPEGLEHMRRFENERNAKLQGTKDLLDAYSKFTPKLSAL